MGRIAIRANMQHKFTYSFYRRVFFYINPHPKFSDLLIFSDIYAVHSNWLIVKLGHFIGFAIMDALLFNLIKKRKLSAFLAVLVAILTEILQMFFYRDGRLYDILIDSAGVMLAYQLSNFRLRKIQGLEKKD
ncbi:VanZ family protein [Paenibacillus sp. P26]|nr:VanZ family protein [Paenibacillus sp. P26]